MIPSKNRRDEEALRLLTRLVDKKTDDRRVLCVEALQVATMLQRRLSDTDLANGSVAILDNYLRDILQAIDVVLRESH
jgi:hypothetical protein